MTLPAAKCGRRLQASINICRPCPSSAANPPAFARHLWPYSLARTSFLRITDRSFQCVSPRVWNQLPASLRQPRTNLSNSDPLSPASSISPIGSIDSPLSSPSPLHSFIPGLKPLCSANPSHRSLPFLLQYRLREFPGLFTDTSEHIRFYFLVFWPVFSFWFRAVDQADLCQQLSSAR